MRIRNEHRHTVSIESKGILWTFTGMFAMVTVLAVALHAARQPDYDRADNDLKYRYIRMKGEASPENISGLENIFGFNRDNGKINQMRKDVEAYEEAVHEGGRPYRAGTVKGACGKGAGKQGRLDQGQNLKRRR